MTEPNLEVNLDNVQGDLFSRGFPKYNETYYFFSIVAGKEKSFTKALATLGKSGKIATLRSVLADWETIQQAASEVPIANALIAFSKNGLDKIQTGLGGTSLQLDQLSTSDPAFAAGMIADGPKNLNDQDPSTYWDDLFKPKSGTKTSKIDGLLKVAGNSTTSVNSKLDDVKKVLGFATTIVDIPATSPPTTINSRVDGNVRPKGLGLKGREHFGFMDGISQPLLAGIDKKETYQADEYMQTAQNIITVTSNPPAPQDTLIDVDPTKRPRWMVEGSFLAFRKLEQDVAGYDLVAKKYASVGCGNDDHVGAKMMGRWKSGAPVQLFPNADAPDNPMATNKFFYKSNHVCPLSAHTRKTNPRDAHSGTREARMLRNGIPYGTEYKEDPSGKRGLLFAAYQSSIDNGYQFVQKQWSNSTTFPDNGAGYDPFSSQPPKGGNKIYITMFDPKEQAYAPGLGTFPKIVTMKGGEYFFVPSLSALTKTLGSA